MPYSEDFPLQLPALLLQAISVSLPRRFFKDMPHNALDKKSNFELLE